MPGWLWVVVAVVLAVVIYLMLRRGGGRGGRHRGSDIEYAPAIEYAAPAEEALAEPPAERDEDRKPEDREEEHEEEREEEREELAEDAELRHDEGYVETLGNQPSEEIDALPPPERPAPRDDLQFGAGSAASGADGRGPEGWTVKGNADSLLFYTLDAPGYHRSAADVWFESEAAATAAGFTRWDAHHR